MKTKDKLIDDVKNLDYVKRIKEIESYIDNNAELKKMLNEKKKISKEIVMAKQLGLVNTLASYEAEYKALDSKIAEYPLIEEYMDLLEEGHNDLSIMIEYIENKINSKIEN